MAWQLHGDVAGNVAVGGYLGALKQNDWRGFGEDSAHGGLYQGNKLLLLPRKHKT